MEVELSPLYLPYISPHLGGAVGGQQRHGQLTWLGWIFGLGCGNCHAEMQGEGQG